MRRAKKSRRTRKGEVMHSWIESNKYIDTRNNKTIEHNKIIVMGM